jgi:NADPH:quinone reductase-like Zn-dependent oxidoreductase
MSSPPSKARPSEFAVMTEGNARAFWVTGAHRGEIRAERLPAPGPNECVVRALYSGISRGTEALVFANRVPVSEYSRMRAPFQAGEFPAPVKYGYASVGEVEEGPSELRGSRVFCLYPHQTRYVVPARAVHRLPDDVPPERAVLAANLETAVNGLWDAAPHVGDRIAVVGAGTVGCLVAWLAAGIPGCAVELIDINPDKAAAARALKVPFRAPDAATEAADLVIHTSGAEGGLATALSLAGFEARVIEMSWYGAGKIAAPLGERFHSQRLSLRSSQVGAIAPAQRSRWSTERRIALVLQLLGNPVLDALITGESPFDDLPAIMRQLGEAPGAALCHRISFG